MAETKVRWTKKKHKYEAKHVLSEHQERNVKSRLNAYGLTPKQFEAMLQAGCSICGDTDRANRNLCLDHDHRCCPGRSGRGCPNCFRGLLCRKCNWILGHCGDDYDRLHKAADYLKAKGKPGKPFKYAAVRQDDGSYRCIARKGDKFKRWGEGSLDDAVISLKTYAMHTNHEKINKRSIRVYEDITVPKGEQ